MARIIYGSIITDIKGSIGGITFQKNGSGTIARLKPRKTKTNTQKQRDQQPRLKEVQRNWNELTLSNKLLWNEFASINNKIGLNGQPKTLTGYQWFLTINQNRLLFDDAILLVPPIYEIVNPIDSITLIYNQTVLYITPSTTIDSTIYNVACYCSFVIKSASKFDFNKTRLINKNRFSGSNYILNWPFTSNNNWQKYFNSNFPPILNNQNFYIQAYLRIISKSSGIASLAYTVIAHFVWDGTKYIIES